LDQTTVDQFDAIAQKLRQARKQRQDATTPEG
jgi:hypothetical protein